MDTTPPAPTLVRLQLDRSLLVLKKDEEEFFTSETGITSTDELKEHIYSVQEEAYKVHPFPCIRQFQFTAMNISRQPSYQDVVKLAKARTDAIFLEAGSSYCMAFENTSIHLVGCDSRKIVRDGFTAQNIIATDLYPEFWNLGHKLFKSSTESFPAKFVPGDIFDPKFLALPDNDENPTHDLPDLQSLTSLTPLQGHVSVVFACLFFHLFSEEKQFQLARLFAGLLDPRPGSTIFGFHGGLPRKGLHSFILGEFQMFCHSPESWIDLWENQVFEKGTVKAEVSLTLIDASLYSFDLVTEFYIMSWSVRRV